MTNEERAAQAVAEVETVTGQLPVQYEGEALPQPRQVTNVGEAFVAKLGDHWRLAKMLVASDLLPNAIKRPEQAIAVMLKGRELNLPPMQAFSSIHIIEGKPSLAASLMVALCVRDAGCTFTTLRKDADGAEVRIERPGWQSYTGIYTREMAERVKYHTRNGMKRLVEKDNWQNYPEAMFWSRAASDACRTVCPDILAGMYTPEEVMPEARVDAVGALVEPVEAVSVEDTRATELRQRIADQRQGMSPVVEAVADQLEPETPAEVFERELREEPVKFEPKDEDNAAVAKALKEPGPGPAVLDAQTSDGTALPPEYTVVNTSPGWYLPCFNSFPLTQRKYRSVAEAADICMDHAVQEAERALSAAEEAEAEEEQERSVAQHERETAEQDDLPLM